MKKVNLLSKTEMKKVIGGVVPVEGGEEGAGCCVHDTGWANSNCGYTSAEAQSVASQLAQSTGNRWFWCCASC